MTAQTVFNLRLSLLCILTGLSGCSTFNSAPISTFGTAELTPTTNLTRDLVNLPEPKGRVVTAVYGFKDQTGQYKANPDSNFSTAVTQGGSAILVKALRDSKWFIPVERENLQNILTERKIVRALEQPDGENSKPAIKLPSLTGAKLLIEGAVIGYDSNIKTGGLGVKYLGVGSAGQYRADQVTVNLRAVDINSGQILHSVSTTKTVYSTQLTSGVYKFIAYKSLLEAEVGTTMNEPVQIAVQEAIEAAVVNLITEGIDNRSWLLASENDRNAPVLQRYRQDRLRHIEIAPANAPIQLASTSNHHKEQMKVAPATHPVAEKAVAVANNDKTQQKSLPVAAIVSDVDNAFDVNKTVKDAVINKPTMIKKTQSSTPLTTSSVPFGFD